MFAIVLAFACKC